MITTSQLLAALVLVGLIATIAAWLGLRGWRRLMTRPPKNFVLRHAALAFYAYLICMIVWALWMTYAEKVGGHLALALYCAAIAIPAFIDGMRSR